MLLTASLAPTPTRHYLGLSSRRSPLVGPRLRPQITLPARPARSAGVVDVQASFSRFLLSWQGPEHLRQADYAVLACVRVCRVPPAVGPGALAPTTPLLPSQPCTLPPCPPPTAAGPAAAEKAGTARLCGAQAQAGDRAALLHCRQASASAGPAARPAAAVAGGRPRRSLVRVGVRPSMPGHKHTSCTAAHAGLCMRRR